MLVQVGGRSGRGPRPGRVVVQTLSPAARPIARAAGGGAGTLLRRGGRASGRRSATRRPRALIGLELSSPAVDKAEKGAAFVAERVAALLEGRAQVLGPGPVYARAGPSRRPRPGKNCRDGENTRRAAAVARALPAAVRRAGRAARRRRRPAVAVRRGNRYHEVMSETTKTQARRARAGRAARRGARSASSATPCCANARARSTTFDRALRKLAKRMIGIMHDAPGVGLAAPQVGVVDRADRLRRRRRPAGRSSTRS